MAPVASILTQIQGPFSDPMIDTHTHTITSAWLAPPNLPKECPHHSSTALGCFSARFSKKFGDPCCEVSSIQSEGSGAGKSGECPSTASFWSATNSRCIDGVLRQVEEERRLKNRRHEGQGRAPRTRDAQRPMRTQMCEPPGTCTRPAPRRERLGTLWGSGRLGSRGRSIGGRPGAARGRARGSSGMSPRIGRPVPDLDESCHCVGAVLLLHRYKVGLTLVVHWYCTNTAPARHLYSTVAAMVLHW